MELKTIGHFLCPPNHDLDYLGPVCWNYPNAPVTLKLVTRDPKMIITWVRPYLMWNVELKTLDHFLYLPNHDLRYHRHRYTESHPKLTFHIRWSLIQVWRPSESRFIPVLVFLENWGKSSKLHPNIPNHGQGDTESDSKSSANYFTSNEPLVKCKAIKSFDFYLFWSFLGH